MIRDDVLSRLLESADRRTFLKVLAALGAGAAVGSVLPVALKPLDLDGGAPTTTQTRTAMGTFVEITAVHDPRGHDSRDAAEAAIARAFDEMDRLIAILSRHDSSTPLSYLNAAGSLASPPPELTAVVLNALDAHRRTGGAFDPTVKPLVDLLEASRTRGLPGDAELRAALSRVGAEHVRFSDRRIELTRDGMGVTLDGLAKGYIVDRMSDVLAQNGVANHLVNAGGDIRTRGRRAPDRLWTIAVEDPKKKGNYPGVIRMGDGAVATSGSYERFYDASHTHHHIVDPHSGMSPAQCVSATVRAASVMDADALSTAVFVLGPEHGTALVNTTPKAASLTLDDHGTARRSRGWTDAG
jgi:thiamine biosynthesis lipoprotein